MPLVPQVNLQPFEKWAIDSVGPINPPAKNSGARYIITATDYLTRWAEAQPIKNCSAATAAKFILDNILSRFGCPRIIMSDQGSHFLNKTIEVLTEEIQRNSQCRNHRPVWLLIEARNRICHHGLPVL